MEFRNTNTQWLSHYLDKALYPHHTVALHNGLDVLLENQADQEQILPLRAGSLHLFFRHRRQLWGAYKHGE